MKHDVDLLSFECVIQGAKPGAAASSVEGQWTDGPASATWMPLAGSNGNLSGSSGSSFAQATVVSSGVPTGHSAVESLSDLDEDVFARLTNCDCGGFSKGGRINSPAALQSRLGELRAALATSPKWQALSQEEQRVYFEQARSFVLEQAARRVSRLSAPPTYEPRESSGPSDLDVAASSPTHPQRYYEGHPRRIQTAFEHGYTIRRKVGSLYQFVEGQVRPPGPTTGIWRLYNTKTKIRRYTSSVKVYDMMTAAGWLDDGIIGFIYPPEYTSMPGARVLYKMLWSMDFNWGTILWMSDARPVVWAFQGDGAAQPYRLVGGVPLGWAATFSEKRLGLYDLIEFNQPGPKRVPGEDGAPADTVWDKWGSTAIGIIILICVLFGPCRPVKVEPPEDRDPHDPFPPD